MHLILITYENKWKNDTFRNFHYMTIDFIEKYGFKLIDLSFVNTNSNLKDKLTEYQNVESIFYIENHDEVMIYELYNDFFKIDVPKFIFVDDYHKFPEKKVNYYEQFDMVFTPYYNSIIKKYPDIENKVVWCPHGFSPYFDVPFNQNPKNKILLSGGIGLFYPLRKIMKNIKDRYKDQIQYLKHPGYKQFNYEDTNNRFSVGSNYANTLNSFICCFTSCTIIDYIVSKYFEIPACGSLLFAQIPNNDELDKLGFIDGVNFISCSKENMEERIKYITDPKNKDEIDKIRHQGYLFVREKHTLKQRTEVIYNEIINFLNNKNTEV